MRGKSSSNSTIWPPACAVVATVGIEPLCATGPSPMARPVAESFFNLLKRERIRRKKYKTREEARRDVFPARAYFEYPAARIRSGYRTLTDVHAKGFCHESWTPDPEPKLNQKLSRMETPDPINAHPALDQGCDLNPFTKRLLRRMRRVGRRWWPVCHCAFWPKGGVAQASFPTTPGLRRCQRSVRCHARCHARSYARWSRPARNDLSGHGFWCSDLHLPKGCRSARADRCIIVWGIFSGSV